MHDLVRSIYYPGIMQLRTIEEETKFIRTNRIG